MASLFDISIDLNETTWQALDHGLEHVDREIQKSAQEFLLEAAAIALTEIRQEAPRAPSYLGENERDRHKSRRLANAFHSTPVEHRGSELSISIYEDESQDSGWNGVSIGELVESGTEPHTIYPVNGKALAFHWNAGTAHGKGPHNSPRGILFVNPKYAAGKRRGQGTLAGKPARFSRSKSDSTLFFFTHVNHPGTEANPFFRRALEQALPRIEALRERIMDKVRIAWGGGN